MYLYKYAIIFTYMCNTSIDALVNNRHSCSSIIYLMFLISHPQCSRSQLTRLTAESERAEELQRLAESEASSLRESLEQLSARHGTDVASLRTSEAEKGMATLACARVRHSRVF